MDPPRTSRWGLADLLVVRYNDNYLNYPEWAEPKVYTIGYDKQMLEQIGYSNEFLHPTQTSANYYSAARARGEFCIEVIGPSQAKPQQCGSGTWDARVPRPQSEEDQIPTGFGSHQPVLSIEGSA
eukprot:8402226-Pyramimonas_sp.AAC.1